MATAKKTKKSKTSASPKKVRDRTLATEKYYIPNYPKKLYIYKLAASPYWWARYFVNNNAVRKSTKTESKREAIAFAKTFYETVTYAGIRFAKPKVASCIYVTALVFRSFCVDSTRVFY